MRETEQCERGRVVVASLHLSSEAHVKLGLIAVDLDTAVRLELGHGFRAKIVPHNIKDLRIRLRAEPSNMSEQSFCFIRSPLFETDQP